MSRDTSKHKRKTRRFLKPNLLLGALPEERQHHRYQEESKPATKNSQAHIHSEAQTIKKKKKEEAFWEIKP